MRLHEIETTTNLLSFWDMAKHLKLTATIEKLHDAVLPWLNRNNPACINKLIKAKGVKEATLLQLFFDMAHSNSGFSDKVATFEEFISFKNAPITLWRGGGGTYNPDYTGNGWFSFTYNAERVKAFSQFDGTHAASSHFSSDRSSFWEVKLTLPINQILLYIRNSTDNEVIVSAEDAKRATLL